MTDFDRKKGHSEKYFDGQKGLTKLTSGFGQTTELMRDMPQGSSPQEYKNNQSLGK
ncbi:MAG: hypothetical protein R2865_12450 [Deinococcales bacterium]